MEFRELIEQSRQAIRESVSLLRSIPDTDGALISSQMATATVDLAAQASTHHQSPVRLPPPKAPDACAGRDATGGTALAGMTLAYALAGVLRQSGVIAPELVDNAFEAALSSIEYTFSADNPAAAAARHILESMTHQLGDPQPGFNGAVPVAGPQAESRHP